MKRRRELTNGPCGLNIRIYLCTVMGHGLFLFLCQGVTTLASSQDAQLACPPLSLSDSVCGQVTLLIFTPRPSTSKLSFSSSEQFHSFLLSSLYLSLSFCPPWSQYGTVWSCRIRQDPLYLVYTLITCWRIRFVVSFCWIYPQQKKFFH